MSTAGLAVVSIQSRECSPELLERLSGSTLFPERPVGAMIVSVVCRRGGTLYSVTAPTMFDVDEQVDYFLRLLPTDQVGPFEELRDRVVADTLDDASARWLSTKVLDLATPSAGALRSRLGEFVDRERAAGARLSMSYFEPSSDLERLAGELGLSGDQADSRFIPLGTKAEGRRMMSAAGVPVATGTAECRDPAALSEEIASLVRRGHTRLVLKLSSTEYGAGMGNALLSVAGTASALDVLAALPSARLVDGKITWADFEAAMAASGVLAEELIESPDLRSPSFQGRIDGTDVVVESTHDQVLGGGQTYAGSLFPADDAYRTTVIDYGVRVGRQLVERGVRRGDYGVDFLAAPGDDGWQVVGCEVNLRATGTKHGFMMATSLLNAWPGADGRIVVGGEERVYEASDAIIDPAMVGLRPAHVIKAVSGSPLHYDPHSGTGVVLHLLSALPTYGKCGAVCVARNRPDAQRMMGELRELLRGLGTS